MLNGGEIEHIVDDPRVIGDIHIAFESYEQFAICDPYLCYSVNRDTFQTIAEQYGFEIKFIYFENDPDQCGRNAQHRPNKSVDHLINQMTKSYIIPDGVDTLTVNHNRKSNEALIRHMISICAGVVMCESDTPIGGGMHMIWWKPD